MFTFSSKFTFSLVSLLWLAVMCGCFLTQKVPDKTWRSCQDEEDDDEDDSKQPFREAPPFMGRIRIGTRYLNMKHMNIHIFFANNSTVLVVQRLLCYLRKTCARVIVSLSWFGSAVNPFPSSIINRTVISGSSSAPSQSWFGWFGWSRTQISHMFGSSHMFSASRCVCQSKVRCGSIVKYLLIWGQSKATVCIQMPLNINNGSLRNSQRPATRAHLRNATVTSLGRISPVQMMLFNIRAFHSLIRTFSNSRTD